jgi:23S rRNA (uracil1939-C5)-methyltransferase
VGEVLDLRIEKAVYRGLGLARHEGQAVFVPRAFPGERLRGRVAIVEKGFVRARTEELLESSPSRRRPPCPHAERCGGCAYQELEYAAQLALKREIVAETLRRAGARFPEPAPIVPSPEEGWRTRATLHFEAKDGELRLGFHEEGSHRVVDAEHCLQLGAAMREAAVGLKRALTLRPPLWPRLAGLHLAEGGGAGLVGVLEARLPAGEVQGLASLREAASGLSGLGAELSEGGRRSFVLLMGSPRLAHDVLGLRLTCHARSFFQANRFLVEPLAQSVLDLLPAEGPVLDLYAGVGLFALPLASRGREVRAVEIDETAADDARENARRLGIALRVERSDVREALAAIPAREGQSVVLDPPRTGAGLAVVELLAARKPPAIVYVSCDPATLGRDLAHFARHSYRTETLRLFDMFPDTFHVETVARLVPSL